MVALLEVFRLDSNSNDVGVWVNSVDSLLEALNVISEKGCGEYVVYSQKTGRRRFYKVNGDGKIVFWENEGLALNLTNAETPVAVDFYSSLLIAIDRDCALDIASSNGRIP